MAAVFVLNTLDNRPMSLTFKSFNGVNFRFPACLLSLTQSSSLLGLLVGAARVLPQLDDDL